MNWRRIHMILAAGMILAAAVAAHAMIPRRQLGAAPSQERLEHMIPQSFGDWSYAPGIRMVEPPGSDTLSKQVYNAEIARGYRDREGHLVMLVVAYGASQSDRLQLHRPEICYAAQGFRVSKSTSQHLALGGNLPSLPVRLLVAQREDRLEPITYWMRLGDTVATGAVSRQILKVEYGLQGFIVDGVLVRVSSVGLSQDRAFDLETAFVGDFLRAADAETRRFLIGDVSRAVTIGF